MTKRTSGRFAAAGFLALALALMPGQGSIKTLADETDFNNFQDIVNEETIDVNGFKYSKDKTRILYCPIETTGTVTIPDHVTTVADSAFEDCTGVTGVNLPDNLAEIQDFAFSWCTGLEDVKMTDGISSIGDFAFWKCSSLLSIDIPMSVTEIGTGAFCDCTGMKSISLTKNVDTIGDYAFGYIMTYGDDGIIFEPVKDFTIYGHTGSAAEKYAIDNGFSFVEAYDEPVNVVHGDVNGDGIINTKDVVILKRFAAHWNIGLIKDAADVNADEVINSKDTVLLKRYAAGWKVEMK